MSRPLPPESLTAQQRAYVTYTFGSKDLTPPPTITLLESRLVISASGTTGLRTWESSVHLASFLLSEQGSRYIENNNVLELGAGTGLVSILCAKYLGAKHVLASDGSQDVVDTIQDNIFLNSLQDDPRIECRILKWGRFLDEADGDQEKTVDIILGADIVRYEFTFPN